MDSTHNKVLTFEQARKYLGYTASYMYKLTSSGILPYSKPNGKKIFFDREKLEAWMLGSPKKGQQQIDIEASTYVTINPKAS